MRIGWWKPLLLIALAAASAPLAVAEDTPAAGRGNRPATPLGAGTLPRDAAPGRTSTRRLALHLSTRTGATPGSGSTGSAGIRSSGYRRSARRLPHATEEMGHGGRRGRRLRGTPRNGRLVFLAGNGPLRSRWPRAKTQAGGEILGPTRFSTMVDHLTPVSAHSSDIRHFQCS